ncbi:MAG: hypothetical protein F6K10_07795 [Moorea sp. SIO2B7]|nr:hypothetical protein [Moorena sp. SIO2B7]
MPYILPVKIIFWQLFLLLITIAIESIFFYRKLGITRKTSVKYSILINLLSSIIGWIFVFIIQGILPFYWKTQIIGYIFLGILDKKIFNIQIYLMLFILAIIGFLLNCYLELKELDLIQTFSASPEKQQNNQSNNVPGLMLATRICKALKYNDAKKASVILRANLSSFSLTIVIIYLILQSYYI